MSYSDLIDFSELAKMKLEGFFPPLIGTYLWPEPENELVRSFEFMQYKPNWLKYVKHKTW